MRAFKNFVSISKKIKTKTIALPLLIVIAIFTLNLRPVFADNFAIDFESPTYHTGTINEQDGWSSLGSAGSGCAAYDHEVTTNSYGYTTFGNQSLRISNAVTSGCFGDQTFSKSLINESGETTAQNAGFSGGTRQPHFEAQWDFASTVPNNEQAGLSTVASPDRGDGARMSWIQMADASDGLQVNFYDVQGTDNPANFVLTPIATGLDRTVPHTIKITMDFLEGASNDIVKVYVDGVLKHTGTSWENYYRYDAEAATPDISRTVDSILFRTGGTAAPATAGQGFIIDNFSLNSGPITTPTPTPTNTPTPTPTSTPTPTPGGPIVTSFTLINADTDQPITGFNPLPNNATLDLATLPTRNLNIRANTSGTLQSVKFAYDTNPNYATENLTPYALASDENGDYSAWTPAVGTHTLTATPYSQDNAGGTAGTSLTQTFTVVDSTTILAQDTFNRSNQSKWGTASDGHVWGTDANTLNNFSINNHKGIINNGSTNYTATLGSTASNEQVIFTGKMSGFSDTNIGAIVRQSNVNNWYKGYIDGDDLVIQKRVNGTNTILAEIPFTANANTLYTVKFKASGNTLSIKAWNASNTEPSNWMATATDNTFSTGYVGIRSLVQNSVTATYTSFIATTW